jgi:hypothetical protein
MMVFLVVAVMKQTLFDAKGGAGRDGFQFTHTNTLELSKRQYYFPI